MAHEQEPQPQGNRPTLSSGIDILSLFREDLTQQDRIQLFKSAAEILTSDVDNLASDENVAAINETYDLALILNQHGNGIDVGQSLAHIKKPFITFIESAGGEDVHQTPQFRHSIHNAFSVRFTGEEPQKPLFGLSDEGEWGYWQARGLLAKGSIVAPIDVRRYSLRMLNALIDADYSQEFLNTTLGFNAFQYASYEELLADTKNRGELVMYSNAVRELTSAKQILETLLMLQDPETLLDDKNLSDKLIALRDKQKRDGEMLPAYIMYGTAHHGFSRVLSSRGIQLERIFADDTTYYFPGAFKFIGSSMDRFFNGRHYDTSDEKVEEYAKMLILDSLLRVPLASYEKYGITFNDRSRESFNSVVLAIQKLSMDKELLERLPELIANFKNDHYSIVEILREANLPLRFLDDPN